MTSYDVIGDIHGHADAVLALLRELGYRCRGGARRHADRTAVLVGDLVDRGPGQREVDSTVHRVVEAGSARIVMRNHEFNAIAWATEHWNDSHDREHNSKHERYRVRHEDRATYERYQREAST